MPLPLFYLFALIMLAGGICVVALPNPVSSALSMIGSFIGLAALLIGLNAYFVGTLQVLVYAGAIMVLFLFIIMLLDLKKEEKRSFSPATLAAAIIVPVILVFQVVSVIETRTESDKFAKLDATTLPAAAKAVVANGVIPAESKIITDLNQGELPDVNIIGQKLFTDYNFPLQMVGFLLLVATVGCICLSKKLESKPAIAGAAKDSIKETETQTTQFVSTAPDKDPKEPESYAKTASSETSPKESQSPEDTKEDSKDIPEGASIDDSLGLIYSSAPENADDLKVISGVGPVLEKKLNGFGVYTYKQVANWSPAIIAEFDNRLSFKGRIERDNWLSQAEELHNKKYNA